MMKNTRFILFTFLFILPVLLFGQQQTPVANDNHKKYTCHPWHGKRVAFIGDSFTDPNSYSGKIDKYWSFLQEWLDITPYIYGISGRQWNDVPNQAKRLQEQYGDNVDGILVFLGTNDFNAGVPIGEWFTETEEQVMAATGEPQKLVTRKRRTPVMSNDTYKGRINIGIERLKKMYPDKQIVLLTPMHRSFADFGDRNVQPDESYQNKCGEYIDAYVHAVKEAGNIWGIPVIDMNAVTGMNPMVEEQLVYFHDRGFDRLHPNTEGQKRIALTLLYQLSNLPCAF